LRLSQSAWPGYIPYALSDADAKSDCSVEDADPCDVVWPGTDEEHEAPVRPPAAASGSRGSQEPVNVQRERDRATMGEKVIVGQGAEKSGQPQSLVMFGYSGLNMGSAQLFQRWLRAIYLTVKKSFPKYTRNSQYA